MRHSPGFHGWLADILERGFPHDTAHRRSERTFSDYPGGRSDASRRVGVAGAPERHRALRSRERQQPLEPPEPAPHRPAEAAGLASLQFDLLSETEASVRRPCWLPRRWRPSPWLRWFRAAAVRISRAATCRGSRTRRCNPLAAMVKKRASDGR